jgi:hypothetical protein
MLSELDREDEELERLLLERCDAEELGLEMDELGSGGWMAEAEFGRGGTSPCRGGGASIPVQAAYGVDGADIACCVVGDIGGLGDGPTAGTGKAGRTSFDGSPPGYE